MQASRSSIRARSIPTTASYAPTPSSELQHHSRHVASYSHAVRQVQEDCLEQALSVLESSFAIITSADRSGTEAAPAPSSSQAGAPQRARQLVLNVLPNELQLASIRAADKHIIAMMLIEQFFTLERFVPSPSP